MNDLPFLPGNCFPDVTRTNFIVPRTLSFKNGHRIIRLPRFGIGQTYKQDIRLTEDERQVLDSFQPELIYGKVRVQETRQFIPATVFYDKKILRFFGYFKQILYENPLESYRIRGVVIYYYLEDDTIAIYETPYKNSALNQGLRIRRHRIAKNDQNEPYNWRDLNLGVNLTIYVTIYRICDCDQFTREWLESEGIELQCSEPIPSDPYMLKLIDKSERVKQHIEQNDLRDISTDNQMEGKVLRFYAILDNEDQPCEIRRKFIIHCYLVDNTIDIREIHQINNGYDPLPMYLHRQKVPKDATYNIKSFVNLFINKGEQEKICYLKPSDFLLGEKITIFNRIFLLYDCDAFTRSFCRFDSVPIDINTKRSIKPMITLPQIVPGKPKNTVENVYNRAVKSVKRLDNENRVLRYEAMMESAYEDDRCRRFLIVYRLADDLISVYEKPVDGFGCLTRKFLERSRVVKPGGFSCSTSFVFDFQLSEKDSDRDAPVYYQPKDFYIGAHVEFHKHRFVIIDADRCALRFIEENPEQFSPDVMGSSRRKMEIA